jgi:hypothetical protein
MNNSKELYVFSHIPKTAGAYFTTSAYREIPRHTILCASYNYAIRFQNLITQQEDFQQGKQYFDDYVNALSSSQKNQINYIEGHDTFYGIHQCIRPEAKYFTFFRDPIARTLSLYNFERMSWEGLSARETHNYFSTHFMKRITDNFLIDGQVPDFETWLNQIYKHNHMFYSSMSDYLEYLKYIDDKRDESSFTEALKKFSFVGITEKFDLDSKYLFNLLKIRNPAGAVNKATPYVTLDSLSPSIVNQIKDLNADDMVLYQCALRANEQFKIKNKDFYLHVAQFKLSRQLNRIHSYARRKLALND